MGSSISSFTSLPRILSLFLNSCFLILLCFFFSSSTIPPQPSQVPFFLGNNNGETCGDLHKFTDYESKCQYITSDLSCQPQGFLNYLQIFYCICGQFRVLGYVVLSLSLILLFYLFGNTTTNYFCPSLESLSHVLRLSPIIAGTTLLPLGSGSTDLFSSIISFTSGGGGGAGINCVLGGAFFISCVVSGVVSILVTTRGITVDKASFVRDVLFFLFTLSSVLFIIMVGKISLWGAIGFISIYVVYVFVVFGMHHFFYKNKKEVVKLSIGESAGMDTPLLGCVDEEKPILVNKRDFEAFEAKNKKGILKPEHPLIYVCLGWVLYLLELPLYLPRRLTIPVAREDSWSKPFAVSSVILAPILLATLWITQTQNIDVRSSLMIYSSAGLIGFLLGSVALLTTKKASPPQKCLLPWLLGEFVMSITWTYIIAQELISLLSTVGLILAISPSVLGFTVLAWGNSTGDLFADSAMAVKEGSDGAQIAISGCYAGPLFNTLVGLGVSLLFASWSEYPSPYMIPPDPYLYELIGFFMAGLLWALVILVNKNMKLDWNLGGGLLAIYSCFLFLRFSSTLQVLGPGDL
ncbi:hypothetical protein NMG60_11001116 [Bertholletia excelsa]